MAEILPVSGYNDRVRLASVLPLDTPFTLNVFPTNLCNFRCIYCAQSQGYDHLRTQYGMNRDSMSPSTMKRIVDQCREFPGKMKLVSFMGHGEPLLNRHLPEMIRMVSDAAIAERIEVITNASLLTHELSDALIAAGLTNLRISLQGINGKSYETICQRKIDYPALMDGIRYYFRNKNHGGVFVKVMDIALVDGEDRIFFEQYNGISDRMFIEKVKPVYKGVAAGTGTTLSTDRYGNPHPPRKVCPLPFFSLSVWPDGSVTPCDAIYRPVILGDVARESLVSMWNGERRKRFLKNQLAGKRERLNGCSDCCAPDDVSHPLDVLDDDAERLQGLF
jgi:GTP 3',8-cyclase